MTGHFPIQFQVAILVFRLLKHTTLQRLLAKSLPQNQPQTETVSTDLHRSFFLFLPLKVTGCLLLAFSPFLILHFFAEEFRAENLFRKADRKHAKLKK